MEAASENLTIPKADCSLGDHLNRLEVKGHFIYLFRRSTVTIF